jgi:hypothetical protein
MLGGQTEAWGKPIAENRKVEHASHMMCIGTVANGKVVLPREVAFPDGMQVEVTPVVTAQERTDFTEGLLRIAGRVSNLPADLAANHDHYLHGHPKQ